MADQSVPQLVYDHHLSAACPFWMGVAENRPATIGDLVVHGGLEVCLTLTGSMAAHHGSVTTLTEAGQVFLSNMWEPHSADFLAATGNYAISLILLPEFLAANARDASLWLQFFTMEPGRRPQLRNARAREEAVSIGGQLLDEMDGRAWQWEEVVRLELLHLLLLLGREWTERPPAPSNSDVSPSNFTRLRPAVARVHADLSRRVSCAEAAAACGFSERHFRALFRRAMGVGFGWFGLRARLGLAARYLASTEAPLQDVAEASGFVDLSHLRRTFETHFGCTPARYRKRMQQAPSPGSSPYPTAYGRCTHLVDAYEGAR